MTSAANTRIIFAVANMIRRLRRIFVSIAIAAFAAGGVPLSLALGCIPAAEGAAAPCDHDGDDPHAPQSGCICIHYPAPQAPGSLAIIDPAAALIAPATARESGPAPAAALPAREDPPEPPPPR